MVSPRKFGRLGVTGIFAVAALFLILVAGWLVDRRSTSAADRNLLAVIRKSNDPPVQMLMRAARASRIVFLSDIHNSSSVKKLAAQAIQRIAGTSGLDAVVREVGADQQPYLDMYWDRTPEDASVLLSHARTLREPGAATRAYLDVYHAIWQVNSKLGADQRIRVIAADLPDWPPMRAASPAEIAHTMGQREEHMEKTIREQILGPIPEARIFVFMSGLHGLKSGSIDFESGGTAPVNVTPLAARLESSDEVYSVLVDAAVGGVADREIATFTGTRVGPLLERAGFSKATAIEIDTDFDYLRAPILAKKAPGMDFTITPRDYKLRNVADAYITLGK
jgi:hypothetical protein